MLVEAARRLPYRGTADHARAVADLADRLRVEGASVREADEEALLALLRHVSRDPRAYGGTDRMTAAEQEAWRRERGPIVALGDLMARLSTRPRDWPDFAAWWRAYGRQASTWARKGQT
jgi:hypothetical protein